MVEETRSREASPWLPRPAPPIAAVDPQMQVAEALALLEQSPGATVPIVSPQTGQIIGLLSRPGGEPGARMPVPRLGGMATPLGVYLTDGVSGGGAGFWGLFLSGLMLAALGLIAQGVAQGLMHALSANAAMAGAGLSAALPAGGAWLRKLAAWEALPALSMLLVFSGLRLSPLAGTHAAEHQVVHCLERGQPLVPECVRAMPRVHPRCGTNIVAGFALFHLVFLAVFAWAQASDYGSFDAVTLGLVAAAPAALLLWRRLGGWMQFWLATRPATPAQIDSAIFAARQVLSRREQRAGRVRFGAVRRIWAMGLPQVMLGYFALLGAAMLLGRFWPQAGAWLGV